ncbi:peptide chain release factor 1 [bacterium]|nr:peptide chain release factor 1 [bacterium]
MIDKISRVKDREKELEELLQDASVLKNNEKLADVTREYKKCRTITGKGSDYRNILETIEEDRKILENSSDQELKEMAKEELDASEKSREKLEQEIKVLLLPTDKKDTKNAIMEIRAGSGGEEAALFAGDLYRMYSKFIELKGWSKEILSSNPTELGGFKEVIFSVHGEGAYGELKYESGVHRVQRVPTTETSGRIHTSAASVVVLPEAEDVDIELKQNELRVDVYRSSGPGGQSVNTTDSAVRITHVPTGLVVTCQDEKSQHKNKAKALKVLRARLYDMKHKEEEAKLAASRRSMIGSGDRSAKIRTFNFPQGRVTDHRINLTLYRLQEILSGDLNELIDHLKIAEQDEMLKEV